MTQTPKKLNEEKIETCRAEIDAIDDEIIRLLNDRATLAVEIGAAKRYLGLPLVAPLREVEILDRLSRKLRDFPEPALRTIYKTIHAAMLNLQLGELADRWEVSGDPIVGYRLVHRGRILLHVSGDESNRLYVMAELHNSQLKRAVTGAFETEPLP